MKNISFAIILIALLAACQKDEGESFTTYRDVTNGTVVTLNGVYLHMKVEKKDTIIYLDDSPTTVQVISYFNNSDTSIIRYGHCWGTDNTPTIDKDSISSIQGKLGINSAVVTSWMTKLRLMQKYYVRAYVVTKYDTAYGAASVFETKYVPNIWLPRAQVFSGRVRHGAVAFSIGDKGYLGTGESNTFVCYDDFYEYDAVNDTWKQLADVGAGVEDGRRRFAVGFSVLGKGYIGLGESSNGVQKGDFWEYNPATNVWTKFAQNQVFPGSIRSKAVGISIQNFGYVGLGEYGATLETRSPLADFYQLDPATKTWKRQADFVGGKRSQAASFTVGVYGYVVGGIDENGTVKGDFWSFVPQAGGVDGDWHEQNDFPATPRKQATAFAVNGIGYVLLGEDGNGNLLRDTWSYNPTTDVWTQKAEFRGNARRQAVAFSANNRGFVGTGYDGTSRSDFWEYLPEGLLENK